MTLIPFVRHLRNLAAAKPDAPAITCGDSSVTRAELDPRSDALALELRDLGVGLGEMVTVALPNSIEWFVATIAAWKVAAIPQPVSARLPRPELEAIVALAGPKVVFGAEPGSLGPATCFPSDYAPEPRHAEPGDLDDAAVSPAWKAPTSGGSTGRPKLIVSGDPALIDPELPSTLLIEREGCMVMPGPLYHNGPLIWSCQALLFGNHVVVLPRFDAEATLAAIEKYRGDITYLVPTMMKRIWRLPEAVRNRYDLSSLRLIWHLAEPCPAWLKEAWLDWLGPDRVIELYGGTEGQLSTVISGPEWLAHRGSVGRPIGGDIKICDADGRELPAGEQGEVWLRTARETPSYRYVGAEARRMEGGWESLGDMGWLDADGYLYLGDRAKDMILTGGANVYPAEVEAALQEHPAVRSSAVIGIPDEDKGNVIHTVVEADPAEVSADELRAFMAERLVSYKCPRTYEFIDEPLRDDAGKVRRSALRAPRATS